MNNFTALYLRPHFNLRSSNYNLRGLYMLSIPKPNTEFKKRSLSYRGALTWNALEDDLKIARNVKHFKYCYHHDERIK